MRLEELEAKAEMLMHQEIDEALLASYSLNELRAIGRFLTLSWRHRWQKSASNTEQLQKLIRAIRKRVHTLVIEGS